MDLGRARHTIIIQQRSEVINKIGEQTTEWTDFRKVKAEKIRLRALKYYENDRESIEYLYRFKIRYNNSINEDMRVFYDGMYYDIEHVNHIRDSEMNETHLDCKYRRAGVHHG